MNLLDVYCALQRKEITDAEAAEAFGFTERDFKFRCTRWGPRLPLLLSVMDRVRAGQMTRNEVAEALGVTVRQVNHLMQTWRVERPIASYLIDRATTEVKWEIRKKYAIEYIAGTCTIEEAAENAEVSGRQMRRWVAELVKKHFGMVFKDLKDLSLSKRGRLAQEVEHAEGLEMAKQNVVRAISIGERTIADEALDRVVNKLHRKKTHHVRRHQKSEPGQRQ